MRNGARILLESLRRNGVDTVFGYPGGAALYLYDELRKGSAGIRHVLTSHEQGAAHAADGYYRASGRVGVCLATSGPGATNLVTGIATAHMDSSAAVFITCNVALGGIGKDSFQEADIFGITIPITKNNYLLKDASEIPGVIDEAFHIAGSGRPGPVLIDVPKDVTSAKVAVVGGGWDCPAALRDKLVGGPPDPEAVGRAVSAICASERPYILLGGGVVRSGAGREAAALAEALKAPVGCSLMGMGAVPADHPCYVGMMGMHGSTASAHAAAGCDLALAVGTRLGDRIAGSGTPFARGARLVHVDIDAAEIDKNVKADIGVRGDAGEALRAVLDSLPDGWRPRGGAWLGEVRAVWGEGVAKAELDGNARLQREALRHVEATLGEKALIVTDVGQHQLWAATMFGFRYPGQLITSGGFGAMGFGMGAAIGAQTARPDKRVVLVTGDGSLRMNCNELSTVTHYGLPIITVLINNGSLGMVRQWQKEQFGGRYYAVDMDRGPDFAALASAYGMAGRTVGGLRPFADAFDEAVASGRPALIDLRVGKDDEVRPMG